MIVLLAILPTVCIQIFKVIRDLVKKGLNACVSRPENLLRIRCSKASIHVKKDVGRGFFVSEIRSKSFDLFLQIRAFNFVKKFHFKTTCYFVENTLY